MVLMELVARDLADKRLCLGRVWHFFALDRYRKESLNWRHATQSSNCYYSANGLTKIRYLAWYTEVLMNAKQSAQHTLERLTDQATWADIMYELYVKQKIETGIKAAEEGRTISHDQIKDRIVARHNKKI